MKALLAVHGYPPELAGGTERSTQALARALAGLGHEVTVLAGSITAAPAGGGPLLQEARDGEVRVRRVQRDDLYFDHWHKSASPAVSALFRRVLREERPDVLHVHHWLRLSRDLVLTAAREGVPAVASLHDAWTGCPLAFRLRPESGAPCEIPAGPAACVPCAGKVAPRTPWVPVEAGWTLLAQRQQDLGRELELARARTVPTEIHGRALERELGLASGALGAIVLPPARAPLEGANQARARRAVLATPHAAGRLVVAGWGELAPHKGAELLLEARERCRHRERIELRFAGGESHAGFVADLRARAPGARFLGPYEAELLAGHEVERGSHLFVSTSRAAESYGLVLDEARDLGLPALVPAAGAFLERAREADGALQYARGDAAALALVLERVLEEPELWPRLQNAAARPGAGATEPEEVARRALELYAQVIEAGAPAVEPAAWFEERMGSLSLAAWDEALRRHRPGQLGLPEPAS